jgi:hypothetical protein
MDLTKIVLKGVDANKGKDFVSALEELPAEAIQGDFPFIEAYWDRINKSVALHIVGTKDELKKVKFKQLKNSEVIKKSKYKFEFNYKGWRYELKKSFEGTCYP